MVEERPVNGGDDWAALSSKSEVGHPKLSYRGDCRVGSDDGNFPHVEMRTGHIPSREQARKGKMPYCLPLTSDEIHILREENSCFSVNCCTARAANSPSP